jgi:hypothetical protein
MKKNIRYVAVYLSLGRVVPNNAVDVLHNRFGDCKDKVTLMLALLAAKGITGEAALINLGNAYSLPEPPTLAALNHVILYLPEFGLYDDPTVTWAAFGVLAPEGYDKPVVRVSETAATLGRTPAMRPEDHTAHAVTSIRVAADGTITGQTRETSTGVFGIVLRTAGGLVQSVGHETGAQRLLQTYNTPGSGRFDLSNIAEAVDPVTISSSFTLNDRFRAPAPGGRAVIPFGLPLTVRVGNFLLGTRLSGRLSAFACYAGTQTEDIDASFDPGLPMPTPLAPAKIDNPFLSYRSSFQIDGRTLKIHRELTSHVPGQVCAPEVEAQIGENLNAVRVEVNSTYAFGPTQPQTLELKRAVAAGQKLRLDFLYSLNVDCSSMGFATVRIVEQPQHGNATIEHGTGYTTFPESNPRSACNKRTSDGTLISYEPGSDYTGADTVAIEATYPNGALTKRRYSIQVSSVISAEMTPPGPRPPQPTSLTTPRTLEFTRVAAADQKLLVTFVYDLNPDCSSIGYATVRITEQPQHGTVTMENGTGFSTFAQNNIRYECNKRRSDGVVVSYAPEAGFTGADSLTVDVILPDGGFNKRHYAIDVR